MSAGVSAARAGNIPIAVMLAAKAEDRIRCLIMFRPPKRLWLVANSLDGRDLPGQVPKLHGSRNDARALRRGEQSISVGDHYWFLIDRALARSYRSSIERSKPLTLLTRADEVIESAAIWPLAMA